MESFLKHIIYFPTLGNFEQHWFCLIDSNVELGLYIPHLCELQE